MLRSIVFAVALLAASFASHAQSDPWAQHGGWVASAIDACKSTAEDRTPCRDFAGEALKQLFGIEDFVVESRVMLATEMAHEMSRNPDKWGALGLASDQAVLDKARELAAAGKAVVAVQSVDDLGQVAIVMPGSPVPSGKWAIERVPVASAARVDAPQKSVYGEGLNWVFADPAKVTLYVRL